MEVSLVYHNLRIRQHGKFLSKFNIRAKNIADDTDPAIAKK